MPKDIFVCMLVGTINLCVQQVNPHVLETLLKFLHANNLFCWVLYQRSTSFSLQCGDTACSKATLALLLDHGLLVKAKQAELALAWTPGSHLQTREAISGLSGLQSRYRRLDVNGVLRSRELLRLQAKLKRMKCVEQRAVLRQGIHRLKEEHAIGKLEVACQTIRQDICSLLSGGAQVVPASK